MPKTSEVLAMLRPEGGWVVTDDNFDTVVFDKGVTPVTKTEFEIGSAKYDDWKNKVESDKATEKAALLKKLGITDNEAKLLLS